MADGAGIAAITGAASVLSGLVGYLGARLQHAAERDRLAIEQTRLEGEGDARTREARERAREARKALYLRVLEVVEESWSLCSGYDVVAPTDIERWWVKYQTARRELLIGAPQAVVDAAKDVDTPLGAIAVDVRGIAQDHPDDPIENYNKRLAVWKKHKDAVEPARDDLEGAMRRDLAE